MHRDDTPYGYSQKPSHNLPGRHGSYEKDLDEIQKMTDKCMKNIDEIIAAKDKELMEL